MEGGMGKGKKQTEVSSSGGVLMLKGENKSINEDLVGDFYKRISRFIQRTRTGSCENNLPL